MPFWRTYYHLIWATKRRAPLIQPAVEPRLYACLHSISREIDAPVYALNGWTDHVHLITSIPPRLSVAAVVKRLKGGSARDLNARAAAEEHFQWQRGYGVLTLGERQLARAIAYVRQQKEHHQRQTTNIWLERATGADPPNCGINSAAIREPEPVYETNIETEIPF